MRNSAIPALLLSILSAACIVRGQTAPVMPSWLTPFPGAAAQTRQSRIQVESTYTAAVQPHAVVDHYRKLFASAHLPFRPDAMGYGFLIRADADECNLTIEIRNRNDSTAVRVVCAAIVGPRTGAVMAQAEEADRKGAQTMEKYDKPVYPPPKSSRPSVVWPAWLVHVQAVRLQIQNLTGPVGPTYLKAAYTTGLDIPSVQAFYENLLTTYGYRVDSRSRGALPVSGRVWLEASGYPDGRPGRREVVRVELLPAPKGSSVELRVTGFPPANVSVPAP